MTGDIGRFIGIKHFYGESSFGKCDCLGLCRLFYREHGWKNALEDGLPDPPKDNFSNFASWRRLIKYCLTRMRKVDYKNLRYGDFIIFRINGDLHMGVYLGYGKLLSMQVPTRYGETESTIYHREWWEPYYVCAFRRRA